MYYKLAYKDNNVPPPLILGIVAVFVLIAIVLVKPTSVKIERHTNKQTNVTKADIINVSNNSLGIFFRTYDPVVANVAYSANKDGEYSQIVDIRDTQASMRPRRNHVYIVDNLKPSTRYFFRINNSMVINAKTTSRTNESSTHPIYGKLLDNQGKPVNDAIVFIKFDGTYKLATVSKLDGTFLISTCCVINSNTSDVSLVQNKDNVTIEFIDEEGDQLIIKDSLLSMSPFEAPITFGSGTKTINNLNRVNIVKNEANVVLGTNDIQKENRPIFSIIYPASEASIPLGSPLLKGAGIAGKSVRLSLLNTKFLTSTTVDNQGLWRAQFAQRLPAGKYNLIAESVDEKSKRIVLSRSFNITKSGEQVLGEATGSAQLTQTPTPQMTPITSTPIPISTSIIASSTPIPPVAGEFNTSIILIVSLTLIVLGAGIILIF